MPIAFISRNLATSIEACRPCRRQIFELVLATKIRLQFAEDTKHIGETLAGGRACIDRLFRCLKRGAADLHLAYNVLKVADTPGKVINPRHHEDVARTEKIEHRAQLLPAFCSRADALLGSNDTRGTQSGLLNGEVLICRTDPRITDNCHISQPRCQIWI